MTTSRWLVGLFALALGPRLLILALHPGELQFWEYEDLARNISNGVGYVIPHFGLRTLAFGDGNLYSFLAASVYELGGHEPMRLAVVQAVFASLAAPLLFALGLRAFGDVRPAALGAALAALHPGLLAYTTKLHPLGMDVLLMTMIVFWITPMRQTGRHAILAGLVLGISAMSRPTFAAAGAVTLLVRSARARQRVLPALMTIAVAGLVVAPWVARNWVFVGRPVFSSTSLEDVWKGNNPLASGSSYVADGRDIFAAAPPEVRARFVQPNELALDDVFATEVADFVHDRPGDFLSLVARKFVFFWWMPPQVGALYPASWVGPYQLYAIAVYASALVGAAVVLRRGGAAERELLTTVMAIALSLALLHALAYVEGRHRWGIEPLLLLFSARGVVALLDSVPYLRTLSRSTT